MNAYAWLILGALLFEYGLGAVADLLNLRALRPELPEGFRDVYEPERYARSQQYTRVRTLFGYWPETFHLVVLLVFWFAGGFGALDRWLRGFELGPLPTGLLFVGVLALARTILDLPFRWYSTFVIEERFGFNKTTRRTFWADLAKGFALAVALGAPLLAAILWLFERADASAWLWCWLVTALFLFFVQLIAPTWIFPLFNRFEPLEEGQLKHGILDYARRVAFPIEGLFVIDGSRRSTRANAFFTGFGKRKRIALFDTLIAAHPVDELVTVVAHEIGHYKRGHIWKGMALGILEAGAVFFLLSLFLEQEGLFEAFGSQPSTYAGLVFFGLLYAPIELVLSLFVQAFSRRNEFEADAFARETTGAPGSLIRALKRLSAENLANLTPHPLYVTLHYSHPPLIERVRALQASGAFSGPAHPSLR